MNNAAYGKTMEKLRTKRNFLKMDIKTKLHVTKNI